MGILKINKKETTQKQPSIKELEYGTFITDVPSGNECVYIKVKKPKRYERYPRGGKQPLSMNWEPGHCVLLNLSYGTMRQIHEDTLVTPLEPHLTVSPLPKGRFGEILKNCRKVCN